VRGSGPGRDASGGQRALPFGNLLWS